MTREEAKREILFAKREVMADSCIDKAYDVAIKALEQPEIIRCKDCKWWGYDDDDGVVRMCHAAKHNHVSPHWNVFICRMYKGDYYCADAERRTDEHID